jgi:N-acetylneuraminic acid mutarotase
LITGGWDPNAEGDALTLFNDSYLLDCEEWEWIKVQSTSSILSKDGKAISENNNVVTGRTGHSGVMVNLIKDSNSLGDNTSDFINPACVLFGGVKNDECRHNDTAVLFMPSIVREAWDSYFQDVSPHLSVSPIPMADLNDM